MIWSTDFLKILSGGLGAREPSRFLTSEWIAGLETVDRQRSSPEGGPESKKIAFAGRSRAWQSTIWARGPLLGLKMTPNGQRLTFKSHARLQVSALSNDWPCHTTSPSQTSTFVVRPSSEPQNFHFLFIEWSERNFCIVWPHLFPDPWSDCSLRGHLTRWGMERGIFSLTPKNSKKKSCTRHS